MEDQEWQKTLAALQRESASKTATNTTMPLRTFSETQRARHLQALVAIGLGIVPVNPRVEKSGFSLDAANMKAAVSLVRWFTRDSGMVEKKIDPRKGFLLIGSVGSGKTIIFKAIQYFSHKFCDHQLRFGIFNCRKVRREFAIDGFKTLEKFSRTYALPGTVCNDRYYPPCLFDDLGAESADGQNFGNRAKVMSEVIQDRYELWQDAGVVTHFTTNLINTEIEDIYGTRTKDRLGQMCNVISLADKDRRKL